MSEVRGNIKGMSRHDMHKQRPFTLTNDLHHLILDETARLHQQEYDIHFSDTEDETSNLVQDEEEMYEFST